MRFLIGIDEAGRGPLAGPVSVGVALVPQDFDWVLVQGAKDSKLLTPKARDRLYEVLVALRADQKIQFAVAFASAECIDTEGIVPAVRTALLAALQQLDHDPRESEVLLDGGLQAPACYSTQRTIIGGDRTEPIISIASIAAKVERDRYMVDLAKNYPAYGFDVHKGYGTKVHRQKIAEIGLCEAHRKTFCRRALLPAENTV